MNCMSKKVKRNKEKIIQKEYHIFLMSILLMKQERDIKAKIKNINKIHLLSEGGFFDMLKL